MDEPIKVPLDSPMFDAYVREGGLEVLKQTLRRMQGLPPKVHLNKGQAGATIWAATGIIEHLVEQLAELKTTSPDTVLEEVIEELFGEDAGE